MTRATGMPKFSGGLRGRAELMGGPGDCQSSMEGWND